MKKRLLSAILLCALLAACAPTEVETQPPEPPEAPPPEEAAVLEDWKEAYCHQLLENFFEADEMWLCDLNFDGTPELLLSQYRYSEFDYGAGTAIMGFTCENGAAQSLLMPDSGIRFPLEAWQMPNGSAVYTAGEAPLLALTLDGQKLVATTAAADALSKRYAASIYTSINGAIQREETMEFFHRWEGRLPYVNTAELLEEHAEALAAAQEERTDFWWDSVPLCANSNVIGLAAGDLNQDGRSDLAAVVEHLEKGDYGARQLCILLANEEGGYSTVLSNESLILGHWQGGAFGDPFYEISIHEGLLQISHYGGSSYRWGHNAIFGYENNQFALQRFEDFSRDTYTADNDETIFDFQAGTIEKFAGHWEEANKLVFSDAFHAEQLLFEATTLDEIYNICSVPFLPYRDRYNYDAVSNPLPLQISATEALDIIKEACYPDMERVMIPWTKETYANYQAVYFYEPPQYYYKSEAGILKYSTIYVSTADDSITGLTHSIELTSVNDKETLDESYWYHNIDDATGMID